MDTKTIEELVKSRNVIRGKFRALKRGKFLDEEQRLEELKPLIEPLQELTKQRKTEKQLSIMPSYTPRKLIQTPSRIPMVQYRSAPLTLEFGRIASNYLGKYLSKDSTTDTTFGIRRDETENKFFIGNEEVTIANDDLTVGDKVYEGTDGLWQLLTLKDPKEYTAEDESNYREILLASNAHKTTEGRLKGSKSKKYTNIVKPLVTAKTGEGLKEVTGLPVDYVYWNSPNELVDRLRLLVMEREAGNTGVRNEIESIIEELKEEGIIF